MHEHPDLEVRRLADSRLPHSVEAPRAVLFVRVRAAGEEELGFAVLARGEIGRGGGGEGRVVRSGNARHRHRRIGHGDRERRGDVHHLHG